MKKLIRRTAILLIFPLVFVCCDMFESPEPPDPESELQKLMPYTQYLVSYWTGTDNARFSLQWMQHLGGVSGKHLHVDKYDLIPEYLDEVWNVFYHTYEYYHILPNINQMIEHATDSDAKAYRGISRILMAYSLGMMTDAWGDIPYEEASKKASPSYNEQKYLIVIGMELLGQAIHDLNEAAGGDGIKPGLAEDPIYEGDMDKWKRAANVIRLRYLLRMANRSGDYNTLLNAFDNDLFRGNHDNMIYHFPGGDKINPHYFFDYNIRNTRVGSHIVDLLKENDDPRLPVYVKWNQANEYVGTAPGEALTSASYIGSQLASKRSPVQLITYTEQKFIKAEVYYRTKQQSLADQAFEDAVKSSLSYHEVSCPGWEAEYASVENVSLEQIITAKYVALFLQPEVWADYRRTGYPELKPFDHEDDPEAQIPRRYVYPRDQLDFNLNIPDYAHDIDIFDRVWWDVE